MHLLTQLMSDIYLRFIQKCFSQLKYVNCHLPASLTPAPTTVLDKFQYLHFSVASKCSRLNRGRLDMEQSSCFVLQKETVPHPQNIWSAITWILSMEFEAFTSSVLLLSKCKVLRVSGVLQMCTHSAVTISFNCVLSNYCIPY